MQKRGTEEGYLGKSDVTVVLKDCVSGEKPGYYP